MNLYAYHNMIVSLTGSCADVPMQSTHFDITYSAVEGLPQYTVPVSEAQRIRVGISLYA